MYSGSATNLCFCCYHETRVHTVQHWKEVACLMHVSCNDAVSSEVPDGCRVGLRVRGGEY
jgi:hypothetical protein